jgi:outer membrane protein insertion porin family
VFNDISYTYLRNKVQFQQAGLLGGLLLKDLSFVTREQFNLAIGPGNPPNPTTGLPEGMQQVFFRGEAQTNAQILVNDAQFSKLKDFRSSVGVELRVQVPIVNVPFRLIYYINPNAKYGYYENLPNFYFAEKKRGFRFTVGRTF